MSRCSRTEVIVGANMELREERPQRGIPIGKGLRGIFMKIIHIDIQCQDRRLNNESIRRWIWKMNNV